MSHTSRVAICATCGQGNPEGARHCNACGAQLSPAQPLLRKTITGLFCDLVESTALAESLDDPEPVHEVLTRYHHEMAQVLERHGGTLEKYIGDAICAIFGVPASHEDDALRAVRAAAEMKAALSGLNHELTARWGIALDIRIGISSGEVLAGAVAAGQSLALGDPLNVAARLQQTAAPGDIVLGESTLRLVGAAVEAERLAPLALKGKAGRVPAYRLVHITETPAFAERFPRPIVGRKQELRTVLDAYRRVVKEQTCEVVVVLGSSGVGKSRLVAAAIALIEHEATVLAASCPSYGERTTFWPLAELVRAYAGIARTDGPRAVESKLARTVYDAIEERGERVWLGARLASLVGLQGADERAADREETFGAWRRFLERVASQRPLVLVVEDLHWAEDALLDFLKHLAGEAAPILALCTSRSDPSERRPGWVPAVLRLEPLEPDEVGSLVDRVAAAPLDSELRRDLIARAGGNPLFAEALMAMLDERGQLGRDRPPSSEDQEVPDTVEALIAARLDALPAALHTLLLDAAVVGPSIRPEAVAAVSSLDDETVRSQLDDLVRRELLHPLRASVSGEPEEYVFWHGLAREVAYRQIPRGARSAKHHAVAEWLELGTGELDDAADLLAHHYGRALELAVDARKPVELRELLAQQTSRFQVLAAERALRLADAESAAKLVARAADLLRDRVRDADLGVVATAGRLLLSMGDWEGTVNLLSVFADSGHAPILRDLGVASCKLHRHNPQGPDYRRGRAYLERAAAPPNSDPDALASLAGTWKGIDEGRVRELYRRASDLDPTDPYPLGNLLEYQVEWANDLSPVEEMKERIAAANERCGEQARAGRNLPWAYYDMGKFLLLLGMPYESLDAYAKAIDLSPAAFMVDTSRASLARLAVVEDRLPGHAWASDFLTLARTARFPDADQMHGVVRPVSAPVVVVAGGTDPAMESEASRYRSIVLAGFRDFEGSVISGGTAHGVSGLVGDLGERYPDTIRTIGYAPERVPADSVLEDDPRRYRELRRTDAAEFTPLEPLSYWRDLLGAGIAPSEVRVLGIGGGRVAAAEYAIALALGAALGVIAGSGRAADQILSDRHWSSTKRLTPLDVDPEAIRFLVTPVR